MVLLGVDDVLGVMVALKKWTADCCQRRLLPTLPRFGTMNVGHISSVAQLSKDSVKTHFREGFYGSENQRLLEKVTKPQLVFLVIGVL